MRVVWNSRFRRAFKRLIKKNPELQNKVSSVLKLLAEDAFTPSLKSHKYGNL